MVDQIMGRYKFKLNKGTPEDQEELRFQALAHALEKMPLVDFSRGKAYSFYSKMLYHFFIYNCNESYKKMVQEVPLFITDDEDSTILTEFIEDPDQPEFFKTDIYLDRIDWLVDKSGSLFTQQEKTVLSNIRSLLESEEYSFQFTKDVFGYFRSLELENSDIKRMIKKIKTCQIGLG